LRDLLLSTLACALEPRSSSNTLNHWFCNNYVQAIVSNRLVKEYYLE
jgi:hypothetical protein